MKKKKKRDEQSNKQQQQNKNIIGPQCALKRSVDGHKWMETSHSLQKQLFKIDLSEKSSLRNLYIKFLVRFNGDQICFPRNQLSRKLTREELRILSSLFPFCHT